MRSLMKRLALRQEGNVWQFGLGRINKVFGHGLINGDGKPAWEDISQAESHEFRRHVYEILRCREQQ